MPRAAGDHAIGALAQMGEQLLCKHQVIGSIPIGSTKFSRDEDILFVQALEPDEYRGAWRPTFDIVNGF